MSVTLSAMEAIELSRQEGITIGELEALGFSVQTAGKANVEAAVAAPKVVPELVAAAELLFSKGVKRAATKHSKPRPKRTLGTSQGTYPYNVQVTIDPDYEAPTAE